jgi:hypothetical protein
MGGFIVSGLSEAPGKIPPAPLPGTTFIQAQNVGSVSSSSENSQEIRL